MRRFTFSTDDLNAIRHDRYHHPHPRVQQKMEVLWLKNAGRVENLLWLYYVAELVQALLEREVRHRMLAAGVESLALYPEGRGSVSPTSELVLNTLEGHRRHRLLDAQGAELRRFHDALSVAAREVLELLEVDTAPYGLT